MLLYNVMRETIDSIPVSSYDLPSKATQDLGHLPGPKGHWLYGNLRQLRSDPLPCLNALRKQYGNCFTFGFFRNRRSLIMLGAHANELVLIDPDNNFSSHWGWDVVHSFFGRNILVRDFEDHRLHRKLMTHLFKSEALSRYLEQMRVPIDRAVETYSGSVDVYRQTKVMALDIAIRVFAGITVEDVSDWNGELNTVLSNVMAHRIHLPGTRYWMALAARDRLRSKLQREIDERRGKQRDDLFSQLINSRDDHGRRLADQDISDHIFGLLFAAHDTTASSLAMMFWLLAKHPDLQDHAREECSRLYERSGSTCLPYEHLDQLSFIDALFKETLRMFAPIQFLPRRSLTAFLSRARRYPRTRRYCWHLRLHTLILNTSRILSVSVQAGLLKAWDRVRSLSSHSAKAATCV